MHPSRLARVVSELHIHCQVETLVIWVMKAIESDCSRVIKPFIFIVNFQFKEVPIPVPSHKLNVQDVIFMSKHKQQMEFMCKGNYNTTITLGKDYYIDCITGTV